MLIGAVIVICIVLLVLAARRRSDHRHRAASGGHGSGPAGPVAAEAVWHRTKGHEQKRRNRPAWTLQAAALTEQTWA